MSDIYKFNPDEILSPDEEVIHDQNKTIERLREQLDDAIKTTKDQELIIKRLKRRRICDNQKTEARKEHINELIEQVKELKEEIARRGRLINELKTQRKEANEVIKWYDGLENMLIGWELCTGQPKGTANKYLEKWGIKQLDI